MVPGIIAPRVGKLSLYYVPIVYVRALSSVSPSLLWLSRCMLPRPSISTPNCLFMGAVGVAYKLHNIYSVIKAFPRA